MDGYHVHADNGDIGHVSGFIFDDETWILRYRLSIRKTGGRPKRRCCSRPTDLRIDWFESTVSTELAWDAIKNSPAYDSTVPLERSFEAELYAFYGKTGYWVEDAMAWRPEEAVVALRDHKGDDKGDDKEDHRGSP